MPVAARVVGIALVRALITLFDMAAEGGGATAFDGGHDAELGQGQAAGMLLAIGFAIATEHVPDFQLGAIHGAPRSEMLGWSGFRFRGQGLR